MIGKSGSSHPAGILAERAIALCSPDILEADIDAVVKVLRSGQLVQSAIVENVERRAAEMLGCREVIAVSSGTAALHLALMALGIGPGDEVVVPAYSFVATANVVEVCGARPVFVDIDPKSFNMDPTRLESAISKRTRAIMPVHQFGLPCEIAAIVALADHYDIAVVEDAACAFGARSYDKRPAGTLGRIGCFSLHPRKTLTTGEGGLLALADEELARSLRRLRNHGLEARDGVLQTLQPGLNYRLTDIQAALLPGQLLRYADNQRARERVAALYYANIDNPRVVLPQVSDGQQPNWQTFHLITGDPIYRDNLLVELKRQGIGCNLGAQCIPVQPFYLDRYGGDPERTYPNAWQAWRQGIAIPMHAGLSDDDVFYVCQVLNKLTD